MANFTLQLLHASDFEAGVGALEKAPDFAAIVDALEDTYENTLVLSSGDNFIPGPFLSAGSDPSVQAALEAVYNALYGVDGDDGFANLGTGGARLDVTILNAIGIQASALGNHEFDLGTSPLREAIGGDIEGPLPPDVGWLGVNFPYLSANLDFSADANLAPIFTDEIRDAADFQALLGDLDGATDGRKIAPATIIDVNGEQIGVVGVTTPELERLSSTGDTHVKDPGAGTQDMHALASVIQPTIDALVAQGIDKIVLLSHLQQLALEQELAPLLKGVDIIVAGGSHTLLADAQDVADQGLQPGDTPGGAYPIVTHNADGDPLLIVNTDSNYEYVGRLVVEFDEQGRIVPDSVDPEMSGAFVANDGTVEDLWGSLDAAFAEGTKGNLVETLTDAAREVIVAKDGLVFGSTDVFLDGRRTEVRVEETNLGDITADANLARGQEVDPAVQVSIKNGGGIREPIGYVEQVGLGQTNERPPAANPLAGKEEGDISRLDIENALRFNNGLTLVTVTRAQLLEVLEHAVAAVAPGATPGQFAQVSGVAYSYDATRPAGDRIVSAALTDEDGHVVDVLARDGSLVGDAGAPVRVITLNFMADGGDGYPFKEFFDADPEFANRVDLASEDANENGVLDDGEDLNRNGELDGAADIDEGAATFAASHTEQDAFADYIADRYSETPYDVADTGQDQDERIQNLAHRADGVLDGPYDLAGITAADRLTGTGAADTINGGEGGDTLLGADGADLLFGGQGGDSLLGGQGGDFILAGADDDTLEAGRGDDAFVNGNRGDDLVRGGEGSDRLYGGQGDDTVEGGVGADTLSGDRGDDLLVGGAGADRFVFGTGAAAGTGRITLAPVGTYDHGGFETGAAETLSYDPATQRLFVTNAQANTLDVLDVRDPAHPVLFQKISLDAFGGGVNSVATKNGIVAVAVANDDGAEPGRAVFFDTDGNFLAEKPVGVLPDMITFSPDGTKVLVANEGERVGDPGPDQVDPPGSISIIDISGGVAGATPVTLGFGSFEAERDALIAAGLRVTPGKPLAVDLEPEYVTVTPDGSHAYVTIQEASAFAVVNLETNEIEQLLPLGRKDYSLPGNGFDASNKDDAINIEPHPVFGLYEPDAVASFVADGRTYFVTANEGDARSDGSDEAQLNESGLDLDPTAFPNAEELLQDDALGRLNISTIDGDTDGDGDLDEIVAFGGRSFSIFDADGKLVFDSGDQFERIIAAQFPENFNADNTSNDFDDRSDNKGPEPEAISVGVVGGHTYAFIGLERMGGVMVYDVTDPTEPAFVQYINNRDFTQDVETPAAGDSGPEVTQFVSAADSPTGKPLVLVANEISGTTTIYEVTDNGTGGGAAGHDVIDDFDLDQDRIVLGRGETYDLRSSDDGDALIVLGSGQEIELNGLQAGQVQPVMADLFLFG